MLRPPALSLLRTPFRTRPSISRSAVSCEHLASCVFRGCQLAFEPVQKLIDDPPLAIVQARARELVPKTSLCQNVRQSTLRILNRAAEAIQKPSKPIRDIERALLGRFENVIVSLRSCLICADML